MNHDDFENKLQSLTREVRRPDPTAQWKDEILAGALREAATAKARVLPPRWLMGAWAVAWAAVIVLTFAAPSTSSPSSTMAIETSQPLSVTRPKSAPTLLALNRHLHLDPLP